MKYSVRGNLTISDGSNVITLLNTYELWKLDQELDKDKNGNTVFTFEAWVNSVEEKDSLFNQLKPFVDQYGESINWHECTHDETLTQPCTIIETYPAGG